MGQKKAFVQNLKPKGIGCLASGLNNDRESVSGILTYAAQSQPTICD
jgi:hypothetical protein